MGSAGTSPLRRSACSSTVSVSSSWNSVYSGSVKSAQTSASVALWLNGADCLCMQAAATTSSPTTVTLPPTQSAYFAGTLLSGPNGFLAWAEGGSAQTIKQTTNTLLTDPFAISSGPIGDVAPGSENGYISIEKPGLYIVTYSLQWGGNNTMAQQSWIAPTTSPVPTLSPRGGWQAVFYSGSTVTGTSIQYYSAAVEIGVAVSTATQQTVTATNAYFCAASASGDYTIVTPAASPTPVNQPTQPTGKPTQIADLFPTTSPASLTVTSNNGTIAFNAPSAPPNSFTVSQAGIYLVSLEGISVANDTFSAWFQIARNGAQQFGTLSCEYANAGTSGAAYMSISAQLELKANDAVTAWGSFSGSVLSCKAQECWFSMAFIGQNVNPTNSPTGAPSASTPTNLPTTPAPTVHGETYAPTSRPPTSRSPTTRSPLPPGHTYSPTTASPTVPNQTTTAPTPTRTPTPFPGSNGAVNVGLAVGLGVGLGLAAALLAFAAYRVWRRLDFAELVEHHLL